MSNQLPYDQIVYRLTSLSRHLAETESNFLAERADLEYLLDLMKKENADLKEEIKNLKDNTDVSQESQDS